ncbi:MAG: hypothetical protein IMZ47_06495 [Firmicutes bacterium]|nr:hypothetical protein [Bacillota bacterium]
MRGIYEKLTEEDGASPEGQVGMEVDLVLDVEGLGDGETASGPGKIPLKYDIEVEWRSWGIKDINVSPRGEVEFEAEILDAEGNVRDTITVSFAFVDIDVDLRWVAGHSYVPESIEIKTDKTGAVLGVELNFYFQSQA